MHGQLDDIQALLRTGFLNQRAARYWLLTIVEPARARQWLSQLLATGLVRHAAQVGGDSGKAQPLAESVTVAFGHRGLEAIGAITAADFPFPSAFAGGMGSETRRRLLRDDDRAQWRWSDVKHEQRFLAHLLVADLWDPAQVGATPQMPRPDAPDSGFESAFIDACPSYLQDDGLTEPFGFRDGLAQPRVTGLHDGRIAQARMQGANELLADRLIAPGEFVLGHRNQYGELTYCPDLRGWEGQPRIAPHRSRFGLNGSYLAVRQIRQNVAAFRRLDAMAAPFDAGCPYADLSVAEKLVGRRKSGEPLSWLPALPEDPDAFRFRVHDHYGFMCPRGAHIRRANPRDGLGFDVASGIEGSKLHRLLRRGRPYRSDAPACGQAGTAACGDPAHRQQCGAGLMFLAFNADLDRQFEFVQQRWIGNPKFADLHDESDPLLGPGNGTLSIQGLPLGPRHEGLQRFTETIGGGYFFAPSLTALRFLAQLPAGR